MRKVDIRYTLLLDYYGALLPKKQFDIANLYYNDDLSLSEIAEDLGITRQGVRDGLERAEHRLSEFDAALSLIEKDRLIKEATEKIKRCAESLRGGACGGVIDEIVSACDDLSFERIKG